MYISNLSMYLNTLYGSIAFGVLAIFAGPVEQWQCHVHPLAGHVRAWVRMKQKTHLCSIITDFDHYAQAPVSFYLIHFFFARDHFLLPTPHDISSLIKNTSKKNVYTFSKRACCA